MGFQASVGALSYGFADLRELLAKASPARSGDQLAGLAAETAQERVAACRALAEVPLRLFLHQLVVPYETDQISRLIVDSHDAIAFAPVAHLSVGALRGLVQTQAPLGEWKQRLLADPTQFMAAYLATAQKAA